MPTSSEAARALVRLNRDELEPVFLKAKAGVVLGTLALPSVYSHGNAYVKAAVTWLSAAQQLFYSSGPEAESDLAFQELDGWFLATQQQVAYLQENGVKGGDPAEAFLVAWVKEITAEIWAIVEAAVGAVNRALPGLKWALGLGLVGLVVLLVLYSRR